MSINKPLFDKIFVYCNDIIHSSSEKNIKNKQKKLHDAYNKLCELEDHELQEFYSIVHELTLYDYLQKHGITIKANDDNKSGPDFYSNIGYIECISITKGKPGTESRNFIEKQLQGSMNRYLSALPRLTSAIVDKKNKLHDYITHNVVDNNFPIIIAVNTSVFSNEFNSDLIIDLILKILYGIGCLTITYDTNLNKFIEYAGIQTHTYENKGRKSAEKELKLQYFSLEEFNQISAILVTNNAISEPLKNKYVNVFINPSAKNQINTKNLKDIRYFSLFQQTDTFIEYKWSK